MWATWNYDTDDWKHCIKLHTLCLFTDCLSESVSMIFQILQAQFRVWVLHQCGPVLQKWSSKTNHFLQQICLRWHLKFNFPLTRWTSVSSSVTTPRSKVFIKVTEHSFCFHLLIPHGSVSHGNVGWLSNCVNPPVTARRWMLGWLWSFIMGAALTQKSSRGRDGNTATTVETQVRKVDLYL